MEPSPSSSSLSNLHPILEGHYTIAVAVVLLVLLIAAYLHFTSTDIPHISGLPEVPGALPIVGHLTGLGKDHATTCETWWRKYKLPTFQVRLGNTRAVVVNSYNDAYRMLIKNQSAIIDRPTLYTFHDLISSTQGFTIGTSPWSTSCKNKRTAVGKLLSRPALRNYHSMFDLESYCIVRDLYRVSEGGSLELFPRPYFQRYALNTSLTLCYGVRMDTMADDLLSEIQAVGTEIELLRSASENLQDYIPLLRWLPNNAKRKRAQGLRERRDGYLDQLMQRTRGMIEKGTDNSCVASAIYKDEENKLNDVELKSVCLSLVSGGFSTLAGTLTSCIGSLSTAEGQEWQDMAYEDIKRHYSSVEDAWSESFQDERSPVLNAIIHEATRYYTISAMNLPRKAVTEIDWDGAKIPPKTMILVNLQAANHDTDHFGPNANNFSPARFLNPKFLSSSGPLHFSFGAGSRACSGQILAHRLMYTALLRILSVFRIEASKAQPPETNYIEYNASKSALVAVPKEFNVRLVVRDAGVLNRCLAEAERRTAPGREDM